MKKESLLFRAASFTAALALLVGGCSGERASPTEEATSQIPIGVYAALTGPTATFGVATRDGVTLAVDEINASGGLLGRQLRLYVEDDQGKTEEAPSVVSRLITRYNVVAVIGENASSRSLAAAPVAQAAKVPMISPSSTNPAVTEKGDYIFRVCFLDSYQGKALATFARKKLKLQRVAILRDVKNDYSVGLADFFTQAFTEAGGTVVADQSYSEGDSDFKSQLTAIRAASPDGIFIPGYYTEAGSIAVQARDLGISVPLIGGDGWASPLLVEIGGKSIDGSYYGEHYFIGEERPAVQLFVKKFRERFGTDPGSLNALSYDAVMMLAQAIREANSLEGPAIRDRLAAIRDFDGVSGQITMGADRNPIKPVVIVKVENGETVFADRVSP
jgi:branched-chain amino acid transport system substrate-binding protein